LKTLSEEGKVPFDDRLTKAEASKRIDELQGKTGRGKPHKNHSEPGGLITPDPIGKPGSLGQEQQQSRPKGAPRIE